MPKSKLSANTGDTDNLFGRLPIVYKLSLVITGLIVLCMSILGTFIIYNQTRLLRDQIKELGFSLVDHMAKSAIDPLLTDNILSLEVLTTSLASSNSVIGTAVFSSQKGEIVSRAGLIPGAFEKIPAPKVAGNEAGKTYKPFPAEWLGKMQDDTLFGMNVISFLTPIRFKNITAGYALITFNRTNMDQAIWQSIKAVLAMTLFTILLGICMAYLLSRRLSRPIQHMTKAIRRLDQGSFDFRFDNQRHDEIGQLMTSFNQMAEGMLKKEQVENALSRYLSPKVAKEVTSNIAAVKLGGRRVKGTVLFADIVGFTNMSEKFSPEQIADLLNQYFTLITKACELNGGMVDKYMGDCAMMVFGVPEYDKEHCLNALTCALLIKHLIENENEARARKGLWPVHFRMGVNTGTMLAGNMGSNERMEYTVVGDSVNLASRLCSVAEADHIIISQKLFHRPDIITRFEANEHKSIKLRGIEKPVLTYILTSIKKAYQNILDKQFQQITQKNMPELSK